MRLQTGQKELIWGLKLGLALHLERKLKLIGSAWGFWLESQAC